MKARRRSHMHTQKNRGSLPVNSRASITLNRIQDLEKRNSEYRSKIIELELKIQNIRQKNSQIEKQISKATENTRDAVELAPKLKDQISELTAAIDQFKMQDKTNKDKCNALDAKISEITIEYKELMKNKNKYLDLKQHVSDTDQQLKDQRKQIQTLIDNLLDLNKKLTSLEAFEWVDQRKTLEKEIETESIAIQKKKDEIRYIKQQISELQQKQEFLRPVVAKWKGRVFSDTIPIESIDDLIRKLANKMKQPPPDTKDLQHHLHEIVKENERKREQILKEKKENAKRIRKIQQVLVEVRKQNRETHEKANIEEQRLIQRILALKEEDS